MRFFKLASLLHTSNRGWVRAKADLQLFDDPRRKSLLANTRPLGSEPNGMGLQSRILRDQLAWPGWQLNRPREAEAPPRDMTPPHT